MSLLAYPDYKCAGVEWLDEIPESWEMQKLRRICPLTTGWTPPSGDDALYLGDNPWANISDLGPRVLETPQRCISDEAVKRSRIPISPEGSLLFSFKLSIGHVSFAGQDMYTNEAIATFRDSEYLDLGFAYYSLPLALVKNANENIYGAKLLNQELMYSARIPLPPVGEQRRIAAFLDRETAKIDALIAKQEQLIATLREDRTATITHAVTKGLDPDVEMTDSGNAWTGLIPKHWQAVPLKRVATRVTDGAHISPDTEGGVYDFVSTKDVSDKGIDFAGSLKTTRASYEYLVRNGCKPEVGDVLFSKDGTVGRTVVVAEAREFVVASSLIIIKCDSHLMNPWFFQYVCQSANTKQQVDSFVKGAGLPRLSISNLRKAVVTRPPTDEQLKIVNSLNKRCSQIDSLIAKASGAIDTLHEYRSALISDAVTGKIDVRGVA